MINVMLMSCIVTWPGSCLMVYTLYCHGGLISILSEYSTYLFFSCCNITLLSEILRGEPASSCTGSTETGVTTGGSTGSAVEDSELFAFCSIVIGLEPLAAVSRMSRCLSSSRLKNVCFSAVSRMSRRFFCSILPLADSTLYERRCRHCSIIRPGCHL